MERALITGITGFAGSHLAELLLGKGYEVYGTVRPRSRHDNILQFERRLKLVEADIADAYSMLKVVKEVEPHFIFHLAGQSFVPTSWHAPQETIVMNTIGTLNVLEAVRISKTDPVIQVAGSSEEYGLVKPDEVPIKETNPLRPLSPYAVSKVGADFLSLQYHQSYKIKTVITRAFNHTGPRRGEQFVTSNFAKQIAEIEAGHADPVIKVGNLEAQRDFTDVRDTVKAYLLAVQKCDYGEQYNIASGTGTRIQTVLDTLLGRAKIKPKVEQDPSRMRPSDVQILVGDSTKFRKKTGWKPTIPFEQTMADLLDYWRERVKAYPASRRATK
jgi:GDP-4-dehydro-6-deoxy-D-mannose reductase